MDTTHQINILYECLSSIGNSLELEKMLQEMLHTFSKKTGAISASCLHKDSLKSIVHTGKNVDNIDLSGIAIDSIDRYSIIEKDDKRYLILPLNTKIIYFVYKNKKLDLETIANMIYSFYDKLNIAILTCENYTTLETEVDKKTESLQVLNQSLEKRVEKAVKEANAKEKIMLEQSKLAIMGEMIAMIAHQWRQPLGVVKMIIQTIELKNRLNDLTPEEITDNIKHASETIDYMSQTINDFRNFFKPDKKQEIVSLSDMIHSTIKFIQHTYNTNDIAISLDIRHDQEIEIIKGEFTQVLLNIFNNAKDVLIDNLEDNRKVTVSTSKKEENLIIDIADNAGGIPEDILPKIFDPYFSTKSKNGTGLGLYMSKIIIDTHFSGHLGAFNNDTGAVFRITLPLGE
jgi:C4-dicarboxylate-specific signal transduction histidine kinase